MLKSVATPVFWKLYHDLPEPTQRLADRAFVFWLRDPRYPALRFKPFKQDQWSARVGTHYRAVGRFIDGNTFLWIWIGSHEDYNKL